MRRLFLVILLAWGALALGQQTGSFTLDISGRKTWAVSYGIGDPRALSQVGVRSGQLSLDQSLQAKISGSALGFITLEADFNDKLGTGFQHLVLKLDRDPWHGLIGDFRIGQGELGVYNKKLLGIRVEYQGEGFSATALTARLEGISQSVTFHGRTSRAEITFSEGGPYFKSLSGLWYWQLERPFVEGFSEVEIGFSAGPELGQLLSDYGLSYIEGIIEEEPMWKLEEGDYLVLRDPDYVLLLKADPVALLRDRVRKAIETYNEREGLTGDKRKVYPFIQGSELEAAFIGSLEELTQLTVDEVTYPLAQAKKRRYLPLGEKGILEETLEISARLPGESEFIPLTDPRFASYRTSLYPDEGILKIDFPPEFFGAGAALKVAFQYQRTGNTFMLGLSVVPGSERVYLNGKLLKRDTDYTIDYEVGMLVLFSPLKEDDVLKVDFERQRGGLGGYTPYERVFLGGTISVPSYESLRASLWRALDLGRPSPTTSVMPNDHTVLGLSMAGKAGGWDYSLSAGFSNNVFPPDDNERPALPNQVNAIASFKAQDGEYVVFAHCNGLTVFHKGRFASYGGGQGLGGREVRDVLVLGGRLFLATDSGLTMVDISEDAPLDRVANWHRLFQDDGFPGKEGLALAAAEGVVYLATDEGIAVFTPDEADDPGAWSSLPLPEGERARVLLATGDRLYLGGRNGVYLWTGSSWTALPEVRGQVNALLEDSGTLYIATQEGIRLVRDGSGAGWLTRGTPVYSLALFWGKLWWAGEDGVHADGGDAPSISSPVTALGASEDALWAGTRASSDYVLDLWRLAPQPERFPQSDTHIDGRDRGHFRDALPSLHTARGPLGSVSLVRKWGDWDVRLSASTLWPGYQPIGGTGGGDSHGIDLVASYKGDVSVDLKGGWHLVDLMSDPHAVLSGSLVATWADVPNLSLRLTPVYESDHLKVGYGLNVSWKGDSWSAAATLGGRLSGPVAAVPDEGWYTAGKLTGELALRPLPELKLTLKTLYPFRSSGRAGDEEYQGGLSWTRREDVLTISASWSERLRHRPFSDRWTRNATGRFDVRWKAWQFGPGNITPRATLNLSLTPDELRGGFQHTQRLELGGDNLTLGISFGQGYRPADRRLDKSLSLSLRWEPAGWAGVKPTLTWKREWKILSHPDRGDKLIETGEATLRLAIKPAAPWTDDLTLQVRGDGSLQLTNRFNWPLELGTLSAQASARLDAGGRLEGKITGSYGQPVAEGWDASAEFGYAFRGDLGGDIGQGLFGRLSLAASF